MKFVRLILFSFLLLFSIVLIMSLFIPSRVKISRATEINAPVDSVRAYLINPEKWTSWYSDVDSAEIYRENGVAKGVSSGPDGRRKFLIDTVTDNEITTLYIVPGREPVHSGWALMYAASDKNKVTIQWYMDFRLRWYPWEKFASLVFEKTYGTMMEAALDKLKKRAESGVENP